MRYALELYPEQREAFYNPARTSCIEATTKAGKTHGAMRWLLDQAVKGPGAYWWVSPVYAQATMVRRRYLQALPRNRVAVNRSENTILLPNGAMLFFRSGANPDHLYGEDVQAAVLDEASRLKEGSIVAVRSTLTSTGGPWRLVGNVRGRGNFFYRLCREAEAGTLPNAQYHKITAQIASQYGIEGLPTPGEIEEARRLLPPAVFRELFLAEASGSNVNPFGLEALESCVAPLSPGPAVCYGVDLAKSVDWTVVIGLDAQGSVCSLDRWQAPWNLTVPRIAGLIGTTRALVDSTGVGSPILEQLVDRGCYGVEGYHFSAQSKQRLMATLQLAIQGGLIRFPQDCLEELAAFEYRYTPQHVLYSAPEGYHDDIVCALALAWMAKSAPTWSPAVLT